MVTIDLGSFWKRKFWDSLSFSRISRMSATQTLSNLLVINTRVD